MQAFALLNVFSIDLAEDFKFEFLSGLDVPLSFSVYCVLEVFEKCVKDSLRQRAHKIHLVKKISKFL